MSVRIYFLNLRRLLFRLVFRWSCGIITNVWRNWKHKWGTRSHCFACCFVQQAWRKLFFFLPFPARNGTVFWRKTMLASVQINFGYSQCCWNWGRLFAEQRPCSTDKSKTRSFDNIFIARYMPQTCNKFTDWHCFVLYFFHHFKAHRNISLSSTRLALTLKQMLH